MGIIQNIWHKYLGGRGKPWAELSVGVAKNGSIPALHVKNYNQAFVDDLRRQMPEITDGKADADVVKLYSDKDAIEREEPKLEVVHMGLDPEGKVKMHLDWNRAFIRHLAEHGITSENEEEAVQAYLARLTLSVAEDQGLPTGGISRGALDEAYMDIEREAQQELNEATVVAGSIPQRTRRRPLKRRGTKTEKGE